MTYTSAKQLFPVGNKPVHFRDLEAMRDVGIIDVGLVVGDAGSCDPLGRRDGRILGRIPDRMLLGLAHAVMAVRNFSVTMSLWVSR
jgi:glucose-1-phosphate thymidylyltransferase